MPFCTACGKEIPEGAAFCSHCGSSQSVSEINKTAPKEKTIANTSSNPQTQRLKVICPRCGSDNLVQMKGCLFLGVFMVFIGGFGFATEGLEAIPVLLVALGVCYLGFEKKCKACGKRFLGKRALK